MHPMYAGAEHEVTRQQMTGGLPEPHELAIWRLCQAFPSLRPIRSGEATQMLPRQRMIYAAITDMDAEIQQWRRENPNWRPSDATSPGNGVSSVQAPYDPDNPLAAFTAGNWAEPKPDA